MSINKQLCDYGCGQEAKYKFKNGKYCCSQHYSLCSNHSQKGKNNPMWGKTHSEKTRRKQSEKKKGKKHTEEHKRKIGKGNKGKTKSEEAKILMNEKRKLWWSIPENRDKMKGRKFSEEHKRKLSESMKGEKNHNWGKPLSEEAKEKLRQRMLNGGSVHSLSFVKNPSKPQVKLFKLTKKLYPEAKLNYPIFEVNKSIDVCIPHLKIALEYDGSYWHQNELADEIRQKEIETLGYRFIRYRDRVPSLKELIEDIEKLEEVVNV